MKPKLKNLLLISLSLILFSVLLFPTISSSADYYNWSARTDRDGNPAGHFETTPFPVDETMTTYSIKNDENPSGKIFTLGSIYFIDNKEGIVNGTSTYNPIGRTNTGGNYTCYASIVSAFAAHTSTGGQNKTFLIREGTYTNKNYYSLTNHWGVDDTHRFNVIGYKQERPVLDAGNTNISMFGGGNASDTQYQNYVTLQRLKLQNTAGSGVYIGRDTIGVKVSQYVSLIDINFYQTAYSANAFSGNSASGGSPTVITTADTLIKDAWIGYYIMNVTKQAANPGAVWYGKIIANDTHTITSDTLPGSWSAGDTYYVASQINGPIYYMNADNGWVYHCTFEKSMGHSAKIGDGSAHMIFEWNRITNGGYSLPGMPYHMSRNVGIDFKNDSGKDEMHNNIIRYNIINSSGSNGIQTIGQKDIIVHHNEVSGWGNMFSKIGYKGGVSASGIIIQDQNITSGTYYSNVIHDPDPNLGTNGYFMNNGATGSVLFYNNLFYGPLSAMTMVVSYGASSRVALYNNTFYGMTSGTILSTGSANDIIKNNIICQVGTGKVAEYHTSAIHNNNVYYYPNGAIGTNIGVEAGMIDNLTPDFNIVPFGVYVHGMGKISSSSIARSKGENLGVSFTVDMHGTIRSNWDIGALEYTAASNSEPRNLKIIK
jgi:hypothetical protein